MGDPFGALRARLGPISDLGAAAAVLSWDQQTYMPPGGAGPRAEQLATLSRLSHELFTSPETADLIAAAQAAAADLPADSDEAALARVAARDHERARRLPADFVAELSRARSQGRQAWAVARQRSDFGHFLPALRTILDLVRRQAEYLGYAEHPYDALLDIYEPGLRTGQLRALFGELRAGLQPLVRGAVANAAAVDDAPLRRPSEGPPQLALAEALLRELGYDFSCGRQDLTAHPFCIAFAPSDVRVTTRVDRDWLATCLFGSLHEMGHALYEQGVPGRLARTPLARGTSLGIHESQSRMWENMVGRARPFWQRFMPLLHRHLPQLADIDAEQFYRAVNRARPSLIRVEADELTYNLHIMLRFELELALIEGQLDPAELPAAWAAKMQEHLGLTPPDDARGVLQDVHWSGGMVGYFPTYTLGNVMAAQLYAAAQRGRPGLAAELERGEYGGLLAWLREHVHAHGRKLDPQELLRRAAGEDLQAAPYLGYLRTKFGALYGI